jgi:hypothetical protein
MVMSKEGTGTITIQGDRMMEEFLETMEIMVVEDAQIDERTDKKIVTKMGNRTLVHVPSVGTAVGFDWHRYTRR